ncbi:MAG: DUF4416 family protein [bacterium]
MARPIEPTPVKLFSAILYSDEQKLPQTKEILIKKFGPIDYTSPSFPFEHSDYYAAEMGAPIERIFYSFRELINPGDLAKIKCTTNEIEQLLATANKRPVNIDAGYLDYGKVVLASMKFHNQKIYLSDGVYADMNLLYEKGHFKPFEWTFPDFGDGIYEKVLLHIRNKYKADIRRVNKQNSEIKQT